MSRGFGELALAAGLAEELSGETGAAGPRPCPMVERSRLELTVHGSKDATYVVNGEVANGLTDMECQVNGTWQPLDHGPLALQAEFAEVYFRNIKIKNLP